MSSAAECSARGGAGWGGHRGHVEPTGLGGTDQWAIGYRVSTGRFRQEPESRIVGERAQLWG